MEDERMNALMKYVRGEISFSEWIESGTSTVDADDDDVEGPYGDGETERSEEKSVTDVRQEENSTISTSPAGTLPSTAMTISSIAMDASENSSALQHCSPSQPLLSLEIEAGSVLLPPSHSQPTTNSQLPLKMTDLLLQGSAADSAKKHGGTGVDEFMKAIPMSKKRRTPRRKISELPPKFKQVMGQANILWARGDIDQAKGICMELIRQVPKCSEPFQTLGLMYEEQEDKDKALQFFLIAAFLSKTNDVEEWLKLAMMSLEQNDLNQALTCYNQALKLEPTNVNIMWDRAAVIYQTEGPKKAMEYYQQALKAVPHEDGAKYIDLASEMAKLYHESKSVEEAIEVLELACTNYPEHVTNQATNMLADLHMTSKNYDSALQVICKYCNIKKEIVTESSTDSPLTTFSLLLSPNQRTETGEVTSPRKDSRRPTEKWIVPENLPIDLRVKVAVCLIHLRQLPLDKDIVAPLFLEATEDVGDLYIDVAEAYSENGDYEDALPILDMLIGTKKFCLAGVWLRKAECVKSLGRLEEAALAYARVVTLAPNHLDARLTLATLHQQLGRPDQALDVLNSVEPENAPADSEPEEAMETISVEVGESQTERTLQPQDFRILFHRCALLQSQNRTEEFLKAGFEMFRLFLGDVYQSKDLSEMALRSAKNRKEYLRCEAPELQESRIRASAALGSKRDTGIRNEEWWEMFKKVVSTLSRLKRHAEALRLVLCCLCSDRFPESSYQRQLIFMSVVALYLNNEYKMAFDAIKILIGRNRQKTVLWNMLARITAKTGDSRHHRYVLRLLIKHPEELPLVMLSGHNAFVSGSYRFAVGEYVRAFRQAPNDPLITLCLAIQYVHLACQRFPRSRHSCVVQGVVFLFQYLGLRGECQEVYYNIGRAFHQLGLLQFAVYYYNKALEFPLHEASDSGPEKTAKFSDKHDLHREAAFNLSLIYRTSGNELMAKELLMKHCWI